MIKREFYLKALRAGAYKKTAWNIACFALVQESPDAWKTDPYPYRLVPKSNGSYFVDPETAELVHIEDSVAGRPLFIALEEITLNAGDADNVYETIHTTYGNLLTNYFACIHGFGGKIPFFTGRFAPKDVERAFTNRLVDEYDSSVTGYVSSKTHTKEEAINTPVYIDELIRFGNSVFSTVAYTQVFTPADSPKTLTAPPGLIEFRKSLIEKYKKTLHQRETVGQIAKELEAFDAAYLKGDVSEGFLISKKSRSTVRMKMHLMYGAETGIEEKVDVVLIEKSLAEGWDVSKFPELNNALRAGSFNRGKQTESGGEAFKDLIRAAANLKINVEDCGDTTGIEMNTKRKDWLVGFSVIEQDKTITKVTNDNVGNYLGKSIRLRSPAFCVGNGGTTSLCKTCLGDRLSNNPTGLSVAIADYGSVFLALFLGAAHSKAINLKKMNVRALMS